MSVDNSSIDSAAEAAIAPLEPDSAVFFSTSTRIPNEAGGWTLLLIPVLVCLALLVFMALVPHA